MRQIKEVFLSEKGMKIVNGLFFFAAIFYRSGLMFIAQLAWIVYLGLCIRHTESKGSRIVYSMLTGIAAILICLNLYALLRE